MSLKTYQHIENCSENQEDILDFFNDLFGFFKLTMVVVTRELSTLDEISISICSTK